MKLQVFTLLKKELKTIFTSYSFWFAFLFFYLSLAIGFVGFNLWFDANLSDFQLFFSLFPLVLIVVLPMLTISVWSDEYKTNTAKLLFLFPVSEFTLVLCKYLAVVIVFSLMLLTSFVIPLSVVKLTFFESSKFFFSYFATFLFALSCIALSISLASISSEPALSLLFSIIVIAFFSLIQFVPKLIELPKLLENIIYAISFQKHFQNATLGIFHFGDFLFFIALIILGLSTNTFILKLKRERL